MAIAYFLSAVGLILSLTVAALLERRGYIVLADASKRIGCIDGVRGYLAFAVFITHFNIWTFYVNGVAWEADALKPYIQHGPLNMGHDAVVIFFMITGTLFYRFIHERVSPAGWKAFFIGRVFRLTPVMWAAVALVALLSAYMQMRSGVFRFHLDDVARIFAWMSFFFSPKIFDYDGSMTVIAGVTWTLKYEWIYYVSIPIGSLVYRAIHRWCGSNMLSLIIVGVSYTAVFRLIEMLPFKIMSLLSLSYVYFPLFFLGMLAVELVKIERIAQFLRSRTASVLGAVAFLLEVSGSLNSVRNIILDYFLLFSFYAPVVAGNGYFGILSARCSIALGNLTYTVYLMHGIVLFVFFNVVRGISSSSDAIGYWYALPVVSIAVVIVAALVHYFIEEKGIALGRSLVGKYVYGTRANAIG